VRRLKRCGNSIVQNDPAAATSDPLMTLPLQQRQQQQQQQQQQPVAIASNPASRQSATFSPSRPLCRLLYATDSRLARGILYSYNTTALAVFLLN